MNDTKQICPFCKDLGFIYYEEEGRIYSKPCKCTAVREAKRRLERSGLAKLFQTKTFESFETNGDWQLEDAKRTAMQYAESFTKMADSESNSLLLCGQVGAGKTHLGTACSVRLIDQGVPVIYMGYREEMTSLKSKVTDSMAYTKEVNRFKEAEVLFIDDFLKGRVTEADVNIVYEIINYRYNNDLPLIISTEKSLGELISFDEAVGSRIIEMCRGHIVVFEGENLNYRLYRGENM